MDNLLSIGVIALVLLSGLLGIGFVFSRLYRRSSKDLAFVRTGSP